MSEIIFSENEAEILYCLPQPLADLVTIVRCYQSVDFLLR